MLEITREEILGTDISDWLNNDGTLNVHKMQADIKRDMLESHERTMRWQRWALLHGLVGHTKHGAKLNLPEEGEAIKFMGRKGDGMSLSLRRLVEQAQIRWG
jgi:hypothetical protein